MNKKFMESPWFSLVILIILAVVCFCGGFQTGYIEGIDEVYELYQDKCSNVTALQTIWNNSTQ